MYNKLMRIISESGIWKDRRVNTHAFLLSPSIYKITKSQQMELEKLGFALYDCLLGLSHIATIAYDGFLNYKGDWTLIRRLFSTGVPKIYQGLQGMNIKHIPKLLKIDMMVDQNGKFRIAEIDGHNKHGLGYSTLALRFREELFPESDSLPGVICSLALEIKRMNYSQIKLLYADRERFYFPEFEIVKDESAKYGITCQIVSEMQATKRFVQEGLFLDLPFFYHELGLYDSIVDGYKNGQVEFIISPKPFFGSKAMLAFLRNDNKNSQLEAILNAFIDPRSLELVREYIPETFLVGKNAENAESIRNRIKEKNYVLKRFVSSGMKGIYFSDNGHFENALSQVEYSGLDWILQEEVTNQPQTFSWYQDNGNKEPALQTTNDWFMRVTAQYVNRKLGDIIVTARRDKSVHGAKDCIQIGSIVV